MTAAIRALVRSLMHRVATAFGPHSRKVWRAIVGATWSLPFRYVTFGAQLAALSMVTGVSVSVPMDVAAQALSVGVVVGWALRVLDNLLNEFIVFEWFKKFFKSES